MNNSDTGLEYIINYLGRPKDTIESLEQKIRDNKKMRLGLEEQGRALCEARTALYVQAGLKVPYWVNL